MWCGVVFDLVVNADLLLVTDVSEADKHSVCAERLEAELGTPRRQGLDNPIINADVHVCDQYDGQYSEDTWQSGRWGGVARLWTHLDT